jgi:DNA-binding MarR family transcriptional regulator
MQTVNRRNRDFNPALSAVGLSIAEWRAMAVINRLDGCLMSELAEFTTVDRTTLTRTIDHLSAKELTVRVASPQDRRQVRVELTAQGRIVIDQAVNALRTHNERALGGLSDDELTTLRALLQRILRNLIEKPDHQAAPLALATPRVDSAASMIPSASRPASAIITSGL